MGAADVDRKMNAALAACRAALDAITGLPTPQERIEAAGQLTERLKQFSDAAAAIRNDDARRIWETEALSLAHLANRIGVSKARAAQLADRWGKEQVKGDGDA